MNGILPARFEKFSFNRCVRRLRQPKIFLRDAKSFLREPKLPSSLRKVSAGAKLYLLTCKNFPAKSQKFPAKASTEKFPSDDIHRNPPYISSLRHVSRVHCAGSREAPASSSAPTSYPPADPSEARLVVK